MAVTYARSSTTTFTRVSLIKLQVDRVLARSNIGAYTIRKVLEGIDRQWIADVLLYAFDGSGSCWAELHMKIDWERNQFHVTAGRGDIAIDARWRNDVAIEVEKTIALFEEYCSGRGYKLSCRTRYAPGVDRNHANTVLGFTPGGPINWAGEYVGTAMTVPEMDEFTIGINLVDPD